jgi:hypothetical protein
MYTTAAGLLLAQMHARRDLGGRNGQHRRLGRIRSRVTEWVKEFF